MKELQRILNMLISESHDPMMIESIKQGKNIFPFNTENRIIAYLHSEAKDAFFKYHFQQLKPSCCDIFIWIGVCRDELLYWVLTSSELIQSGNLGPQHRNENTGISGIEVFEGQVFMTEDELSPFRVAEQDVLHAVLQKGGSYI